MNAEDFYLVANHLETQHGGLSEPFVRSAVSRYYYGAYHEARAFLTARQRNLSVTPSGDAMGPHEAVRQWLGSEDEEAGEALAELRQRRTWADYRLNEPAHPYELDEVRARLRDLRRGLGL